MGFDTWCVVWTGSLAFVVAAEILLLWSAWRVEKNSEGDREASE